jgi:uncharacterized membrane protein
VLSAYTVVKFLHVVAVIVWVGGVFTLVMVNGRASRTGDAAAMQGLAMQGQWFGQFVLGPAAMTTLASGIILAVLMKGGMPLWMISGLVGAIASVVIGAAFQGRAALKLRDLAQSGERGPALAAAQRRVRMLAYANLAILFAVVAAMVIKPT